jgi:hypothetical protein
MPRVSKASRQAGIIYRKLSLRLPVRDIATIKAAADREKKTLQAYVADALGPLLAALNSQPLNQDS